MSERVRLDVVLEQRGLTQSRARARDAIQRGTVRVAGQVARKPGQIVDIDAEISIDDPAGNYVSRAALKLIAGLDAGGIGVEEAVCLDLGASTGGFTQVLLERGAARVYAVDVGHGQLHPSLAGHDKITLFEGFNARDLTATQVPEPVDLLVSDISFVSLTKVIGPALDLVRPGGRAVLLIKPQFEVGRDFIGKGGIVSDPEAAQRAVKDMANFVILHAFVLDHLLASPITGGDGNQEWLGLFTRRG